MKHFIGGWAFGFIFLSFLMIRQALISDKNKHINLVPLLFYAIFFGLAAWGLIP